MERYTEILKDSKLFAGVGAEEIATMLQCLGASCRSYKKGEYVFRSGEHIRSLAILAEGKLHIQKDDYWGKCSILNVIEAGEMFAEAYLAPDSGALLNDVVAMEESTVLFFDVQRILRTCPSACRFHALTVQNLFYTLSEKNRKLVSRLAIASKRSTREKLIAYLSEESKRQGRAAFDIPFNRQQLADFLSVDRSAMSGELCRMRDEGLLDFERKHFTLHREAAFRDET